MATTEYTNARENLKESKAELFSFENNRLVRSDELIRNWPSVNETIFKECHDFADQFVSAANTKPQRWVKDPMARKEAYPGTWRLVLNAYNPNRYGKATGLVQILRKGFASNLEWDEAIMAKGDDLQESERYVHIAFPNIDPSAVASIIAELSTHTTAGFTIEGKARTGTWEWVHIRPDRLDDGSVTINVLAAQPQFTITTYENYGAPDQRLVTYLNNVPKRLAQSVSNGWTNAGDSGTASYSTDQGVVDLIFRRNDAEAITILDVKTAHGCQVREYTDFYYNLTQAQVDAFDIGTPAQGWFYSAPQIRYAGDGKYTVSVVREHAIATDSGTHTSEKTLFSSTTTAVKENQLTLSSIATVAAGTLKRLRARINKKNCTWDEELDTETATPLDKDAVVIETALDSVTTRTDAFNKSTLPVLAAATGFLYRLIPSLNRFGWWDYHHDVEEATLVTKAEVRVQEDFDSRTYQENHINANSIPSIDVTQGITTWINAAVSRFNRWTYTRFVKLSKAWSVTVSIETQAGQTQTHIVSGNQRSSTMPVRPAGTTQSLSGFKRNVDDTYNSVVVQQTSDEYLGTGGTASFDRYRYEYSEFEHVTRGWEWYRRTITITTSIKQFETALEAYTWVGTGSGVAAQRPIQNVGFKMYVGYKESNADGSWYNVETGNILGT